MSFSTLQAFVNFKEKSGYRQMTGPAGEVFMYKAWNERMAIYSWNATTKNAEQMILPFGILEDLLAEAL